VATPSHKIGNYAVHTRRRKQCSEDPEAASESREEPFRKKPVANLGLENGEAGRHVRPADDNDERRTGLVVFA
jgi:hypothetical protein